MATAEHDLGRTPVRRWTGTDTTWTLSLFGTAVGAGILYLPIVASMGGMWPLIAMTILIYPMTYLGHRALCRIVLNAEKPGENITEAVEEYFGRSGGLLVTVIYFLSIFAVCLIYATAITNDVGVFLSDVLDTPPPPRWLLSIILILIMTLVVFSGSGLMTKIASALTFPLIAILFVLSVLMIPEWELGQFREVPTFGAFISGIFLGIPVLVFAMNHSAIVSTFAVAYRKEFTDPDDLDRKTGQVLNVNALVLLGFVMFFVYSVALTLTPAELQYAIDENLSAMAIVGQAAGLGIVGVITPIVAMIAIATSYFGHFCGAREGLNGIVVKLLRRSDENRPVNIKVIDRISLLIMVAVMWIVAVMNFQIIDIIGAIVTPFLAVILFLMPVYAIHKVPRLAKYRSLLNIFVVVMGLVAIGGYMTAELVDPTDEIWHTDDLPIIDWDTMDYTFEEQDQP